MTSFVFREVHVIKRGFQSLLLVIAVVVVPLGCKGRGESRARTDETQTIAPAAARPADTGTAEMTQTVELQDGRSEAEGGVLSSPSQTTGTTATTTTARAVTGTSGSTAPTTATTRTQ
jgi:hypothetical protein